MRPSASACARVAIRDAVRHLDVDAGFEREHRSLCRIRGNVVDSREFLDRVIVADDRALVAPFAAQHVAEQPGICVARHAVDLVVRRHQRPDAGARYHLFERREENLPQLALGDLRRAGVGAAFRLPVAGHVLERGEHFAVGQHAIDAVALQALHRSDAHLTDEIGILAESLLDAAPAGVARHVDHGREHELRTPRANLARGDRVHRAYELAVPGRGERDRLGEAGRTGSLVTVQSFFVEQDRNAEPRLPGRIRLQRIHECDRGARVAPWDHARRARSACVVRTGELTDTVRQADARFRQVECELVVHDGRLVVPDRRDLRDLLVDAHARNEVLDAGLDRRRGILIYGVAGDGRCFCRAPKTCAPTTPAISHSGRNLFVDRPIAQSPAALRRYSSRRTDQAALRTPVSDRSPLRFQ